MDMHTSPEGIALMHYFEGCRLQAYPDPGTGGHPWTIGWGDTGPDVRPGLVITQDEADERFVRRLADEFEPGVRKAIKRQAKQCEFDAFVSFAYNAGIGNFTSSTALRRYNMGDVAAGFEAITWWNKAGGKVMKGLQRRRAAEQALGLGATAKQAIATALKAFP